jgi:hypothetical protein
MQGKFPSLAVASAAALMILAPTAVAAATPVQNGCPAAAELVSVAELEASGPYQLPGILDDPANGGNGDGWICAFPLPEAVEGGAGFTVYQFFENNLKAEGRP